MDQLTANVKAFSTSLDLKDMITVSLAAVGAVLGVINTIHSLNQRRVRLRVTPRFVIKTEAGGIFSSDRSFNPDGRACIEIVNLSTFPVTVSQVGYTRLGKKSTLVIIRPNFHDGKPWPRRLEPRESVVAYIDNGIPSDAHKAFGFTDCGEKRYGDSPALKAFRDYQKL